MAMPQSLAESFRPRRFRNNRAKHVSSIVLMHSLTAIFNVSMQYPDFKHVSTGESLWIAFSHWPHWVAAVFRGPYGDPCWGIRAQYREGERPSFQNGCNEGNVKTNRSTLLAALKACSSSRDLERGKIIHAAAIESGDDSNTYVGNTLINMYAKCASMADARRVFDKMPSHTVVSWTALVLGYADNAQGELALELFACMRTEGCAPNARTFVAALTACTSLAVKEEGKQIDGKLVKMGSLEKGMAVHSQAASNGCDSDIYVANTLVDMYAKCGNMVDARRVFDKMPFHTVVSWNALMLGCGENGQTELALELFARMQREGCVPNARTIVTALKACTTLAVKEEGKQVDGKLVKMESLKKGSTVHSQAASSGCDSDNYVGNTLVDMYAKCGSMVDARRVFDRMPCHNVVSWNALIFGYAENGQGDLALELYARMRPEGCAPDRLTYVAALQACTSLAVKEEGKQVDGKLVKMQSLEKGLAVHSQAARGSCDSDIYVTSTLVGMYVKCGSMLDAHRLFDKMSFHTVVSWNALMLGYADNVQGEVALELFAHMRSEGCAPDARSFVAALQACTSLAVNEVVDGQLLKLGSLEKGFAVHSLAASSGCDLDIYVASTLVDMYAKCGSMVDARRVFDKMPSHTVVSWTALMLGHAENEQGELALELFACRPEGCAPDARTFVAALLACTSLAGNEEGKEVDGKLVKMASLDKGMAVHSQAASSGFDSDIYVGNTLVDMYASCGSMVDARRVFDRMPCQNVVSWNALIFGYAENGQGELALELYACMRPESCPPNRVTFVAALKACGMVVALENGKAIHGDICSGGLENDAVLATSLVDFYGKCGSMVDAQQVFDSLVTKDLVTWTALIAGYSRQGDTKRVFDLFHRMRDEGLRPNAITFLCILSACSHAGLVDKGKEYFQAMCSKYGIDPGIEHYVCVIDMLGRANQLDEAVAMVKSMPFKPDAITWRTVMGAARKLKNVVVGRLAFESLLRLDEKDATAYVLMANIYRSMGMWEGQSNVEQKD